MKISHLFSWGWMSGKTNRLWGVSECFWVLSSSIGSHGLLLNTASKMEWVYRLFIVMLSIITNGSLRQE